MDVSVIIISFNTKELTRSCIISLQNMTAGVKYEIYVVDNNSTDGSAEMIEKEFPNVYLIKNSENIGFGKANNQAIKLSDAKYVFLLNSDTILLNNALKILYDKMELTENRSVACCGGALFNEDLTNQISYGRFPTIKALIYYYSLSRIYPKTYKKKYFMAGILENEEELIVDYVTGADMFIRKNVLNDVGYFDKDFFLYFEETELCSRFIKANYKNKIFSEAKIIHFCGMSPLNEKKREIFLKSMYIYLKKHRGIIYASVYRFLSCFFEFISKIIKKVFVL